MVTITAKTAQLARYPKAAIDCRIAKQDPLTTFPMHDCHADAHEPARIPADRNPSRPNTALRTIIPKQQAKIMPPCFV